MREPWARGFFGRDYMRDVLGWELGLVLFPARRLMTREDDGRMIIAGLWIRVRFCWQTHRERMEGRVRPRLDFRVWSDADEIATRIAARATTSSVAMLTEDFG